GALAVEADRQARQLAELGHELARAMRLQQPGRIVEQDPRSADLRQAADGLDECLVPARAVEQACVELATGGEDRLGRVAQVVWVVQRVVQAEDIDAARGR